MNRFATMLLLLVAGTAHAQVLNMRGLELRPVEPGVADVDPLAQSFRLLRNDARLSTNFERVYEITSRSPGSNLAGVHDPRYFVRFAGGVAAVFPRSEYIATRRGPVAAVPAGTVFSIGGPIERLIGGGMGEQIARVNPNYVDLSARMPATYSAAPASQPTLQAKPLARRVDAEEQRAPVNEPRSLWTDEAYRQRRIEALVEQALKSAGESRTP